MEKMVGQRVRSARMRRQMTQAELARATDIDQSRISRIERGEYLPSTSNLLALKATLGVSVGDLLGDKATAPAPKPNSDQALPAGLEALLGNAALLESLAVTQAEVDWLMTVDGSDEAGVDQWVSVLMAYRGLRKQE